MLGFPRLSLKRAMAWHCLTAAISSWALLRCLQQAEIAVADNPLFLVDENRVLTGANFQGAGIGRS